MDKQPIAKPKTHAVNGTLTRSIVARSEILADDGGYIDTEIAYKF